VLREMILFTCCILFSFSFLVLDYYRKYYFNKRGDCSTVLALVRTQEGVRLVCSQGIRLYSDH